MVWPLLNSPASFYVLCSCQTCLLSFLEDTRVVFVLFCFVFASNSLYWWIFFLEHSFRKFLPGELLLNLYVSTWMSLPCMNLPGPIWLNWLFHHTFISPWITLPGPIIFLLSTLLQFEIFIHTLRMSTHYLSPLLDCKLHEDRDTISIVLFYVLHTENWHISGS